MKDTNFVYYDNREEQGRLLSLLESYKYRNFHNLKVGEGHEHYAVDVKPRSPGFYYVRPFIGAAACSSGARFYTVDELELLLETGFKTDLPRIIFRISGKKDKNSQKPAASQLVPPTVSLSVDNDRIQISCENKGIHLAS